MTFKAIVRAKHDLVPEDLMTAVHLAEAIARDAFFRQRTSNAKVAPKLCQFATALGLAGKNRVELDQCESGEGIILVHINSNGVGGHDDLRWFVTELILETCDLVGQQRASQRHQIHFALQESRQAEHAPASLDVEFDFGIKCCEFGSPTVDQNGDEAAPHAGKFACELGQLLILT